MCLPLLSALSLFFQRPVPTPHPLGSKNQRELSPLMNMGWFTMTLTLFFFSNWTTVILSIGIQWESLNLLIALLPAFVSLAAIWFVHSTFATLSVSQSVAETMCRVKVYILLILMPLVGLLMIKDLTENLAAKSAHWIEMAILPAGIVTIAILMPFAISWIFPTQSIKKTKLGEQLANLSQKLKLNVYDIRIWGTGNRIINALVAGIVPQGRTVLITDRLIKEFELDEIKAVYLHEMGHIKRHHLFQRLIAAAAPFCFSYAICQLCGFGELVSFTVALISSLAGLAVIARLLEYDADQFAVEALVELGLDPHSYRRALVRMRQLNPQSDRPSWLHPRITDRIQRLADLQLMRIFNDQERL